MGSIPKNFAPLYAQVAQALVDDIENGVFLPGSLMPTEVALCRRFEVSRITLRAALRELRTLGMVSSWPGVGTRVVATKPQERFVHESNSIDGIIQFTNDLIFEFLNAAEEEIDSKQQAEWLCCPIGERVTVLHGLRVPSASGGSPVCLSTHFIRGIDLATARTSFDRMKGSLASAIESRRNKRVELIRQTVEAAKINSKQSELLRVPRGEAALSTWRWYFSGSDEMLMVSNSIFPRGRYAWTMTARRSN